MEADWEVEIGGGAPVIEACWPGLVDLRTNPERAAQFPEVRDLPSLGDVLAQLNGTGSPVWTSKCDVWRVEEFDADELDAPPGLAEEATACYIDLLPQASDLWDSVNSAIAASKTVCARLRQTPLRCCRVDLVVRQAALGKVASSHAITAFLTACGQSQESAAGQLGRAMAVFADAVILAWAREQIAPTLQSKQAGE